MPRLCALPLRGIRNHLWMSVTNDPAQAWVLDREQAAVFPHIEEALKVMEYYAQIYGIAWVRAFGMAMEMDDGTVVPSEMLI